MYRKILIGGVTAAAIVGVGGTALAVSGDTTSGTGATAARSTASSTPTTKAKAARKGRGATLLRRLDHAQIVTQTKKGAVTHDLIRGTVTAISPTSITVTAADKKSETFTITKTTKVRVRQSGKAAASTVSAVAKGDHVLVSGTGTSTFTALHVLDVKGK
jgi:hypothetical protein